jgi:hypothetical protein
VARAEAKDEGGGTGSDEPKEKKSGASGASSSVNSEYEALKYVNFHSIYTHTLPFHVI